MNNNRHPEEKNPESTFQIIHPSEYASYGINPQDIPMGTYAAHDHPPFLMSRYGGNAYGFGLVEQNKLNTDDYNFLERIDLNDRQSIIRHADRLNNIYKKLGLLMRFSNQGTRYYLIPINLVAQSVQNVRVKAEAVERVIADHARTTRSQRLDVALFTTGKDLIAHDLAARLSNHRLAILDDIQKLRTWRSSWDVAVFPRNPFEYLNGQPLPEPKESTYKKRRLFRYAGYVAGKIYDLLEPGGRVLVLADYPRCMADAGDYHVEFLSEEEFKKFLLFAHIFKTHQRYCSQSHPVSVHPLDFHFYVHHDPITFDFAQEMLRVPHPFDLSLMDIDRLPHLDHPLPFPYRKGGVMAWEKAFAPYFDMRLVDAVTTWMPSPDWFNRLRVQEEAWPKNVGVFTGIPRALSVSRQEVEESAKKSGMMGCHVTLTASYRNSFRYVADVLRALIQIRDGRLGQVGEVERDRLINPFRRKELSDQAFLPVRQLVRQLDKLLVVEATLNPDHLEGPSTPLLENLEKLSLYGFTPAQLTEMVLIVTGHSAMSRIVLGKMPARNLKRLTDAAADAQVHTVVDKLRICRLMSVAEIAASFGHPLTSVQIDEVFRIYHDAVRVATNPQMDWDTLEDQRISEMGGVQYKALREMLKFFNLFDFLNTWHEFLGKGPFEREVLCDYDPEKIRQVEQVLQLAHMVDRFRSRLHDSDIPRQTFFFRQFLQTEFHGTGHLFPSLGPECGLKLLWVTVQVSPHRIVNFNPLVVAVVPEKKALRLEKIRQDLENLPVETMPWKELDNLRKTLLKGNPIFLHNSGLRLSYNAATKAIDVTYVDVQENLELIEKLLTKFESCKLKEMSLQEVTQLERLFADISSYKKYLYEEGGSEADVHQEGPPSPSLIGLRLSSVENRIRHVFLSQIFVPKEIFDTVRLLVEHCPNVLRFVMPDLHRLGQLIENRPSRKRQSVGSYIMRCLEKFQALILKDRENFQDLTIYYQMAKHEFGPLAAEDIGAKHHQLEILEHFLERIHQERPALTQALMLALLFQDLGKLETSAEETKILERIWTHAERSAHILQQTRTLGQYGLSKDVQDLTLELIRYHGLIGHVIQGSEPITAIEPLTQANDQDLLDTFVLHAILAAASVEEGLMTEDLLDLFLEYRHGCLHVIKTAGTWPAYCREKMRQKGQASLQGSDPVLQLLSLTPPAQDLVQISPQQTHENDALLWCGRQIEAFERLLRLMGIPWVDFHDLQMASMNVPVAFIHHQKGLRSVGLQHFSQNVTKALEILKVVQGMDSSLRSYLLYSLDPLGGALRIYDFHNFPPFLSIQACLTLLVLGLVAYHRHVAGVPRKGLVSFRPLSRIVRHRHEILEELAHDLAFHAPFSWVCDHELWETAQKFLMVETSPFGPGVRLRLRKSLQVDAVLHAISAAETHEDLRKVYREQVKKLDLLPFVTPEQMENIKAVYHRRMKEISRELLHDIQSALAQLISFDELELFRTRLSESLSRAVLSEEDHALIEDLLDHHRSRLRDEFLTKVVEKVYALKDQEALRAYWNSVKAQLFRFRHDVGKEYEAMIASYIDTQLQDPSL